MQFIPFSEGVEVNGRTVHSVVDGIGVFKTLSAKYLSQAGIGEIESGELRLQMDGWYPQAAWLGAFAHIAKEIGTSTLYKIGLHIPANAEFPSWVRDIHSAIRSIDIAYHLNHRLNGQVMFDVNSGVMLDGIGHYGYAAEEGKNLIISACENPYPCDFDRGIITAMAKRFQAKAKVDHEPGKPCRKNGSNSCTYRISW
jgi:hypothetical protein